MPTFSPGALIECIDENAEALPNGWGFTVDEVVVRLIYDEAANRMRLVIPIVNAEEPDAATMMHLM